MPKLMIKSNDNQVQLMGKLGIWFPRYQNEHSIKQEFFSQLQQKILVNKKKPVEKLKLKLNFYEKYYQS